MESLLPAKRGKFPAYIFYSDAYLLLITALVFSAWYFQKEEIALLGGVALGCAVLCTQKDVLPVLPLIFCIAYAFPKDVDPKAYLHLIGYLLAIPMAIVYHFVRFRPKLRIGKQFFPQLTVSVALLMGGSTALSQENFTGGLPFVLMLGLLILVLYAVLYVSVAPPEGTDVKRYLMSALMYMGLLLAAETAVFWLCLDKPLPELVHINLNLGWGISNNAATLLLLTAPACFYLALQARYLTPVYIFIGFMQYLAVVLTFSRGGILVAAATVLPVIIYAGCRAKNKFWYWLSVLLYAAVAVSLLYTFRDEMIDTLKGVFENGFGPSGRDRLYEEAFEKFLEYPLFGVGLGYRGENFYIPNMPMYWFHSTWFQIIGSMGLTGVFAYAYSYSARFSILLRNRPFHIMMCFCMLGFEAYSMIDTGTFVPVPTMLIVTLLTMVTELENEKEDPIFILKRKSKKKFPDSY